MLSSTLVLAAALIAAAPANEQWTPMPPVPGPVGAGGGMARAANGDLYVLAGDRDYYMAAGVTLSTPTPFHRFTAATGTWTTLAPVPGPVGLEGGLAHSPGSNHVYVILGNRDLAGAGQKFLRYSIADTGGEVPDTWTFMPNLPVMASGSSIAATATRVFFAAYNGFFDFTIATSTWSAKKRSFTATFNGAKLQALGAGEALYMLSSDGTTPSNTTKFERYDPVANTWATLVPLPVRASHAGLAEGAPERCLYCLPGLDATTVYRFDLNEGGPGGGEWRPITPTPDSNGIGCAIAAVPGGDLIALRGTAGPASADIRSLSMVHGVTGANQFEAGSLSPIALGGTTYETTIEVRATVDDAAGASRSLQVEFRPVGSPFLGVASSYSTGAAAAPGTTATVAIPALAANLGYHWRVRSATLGGDTSPWILFGGNAEPDAIDLVTTNATSSLAGPAQEAAGGSGPIAIGGEVVATSVVLKARGFGSGGQPPRLQVEVKPVGTSFQETGLVTGSPFAHGTVGSVLVNGLAEDQAYHWRVRLIVDGSVATAWTDYGGNADPGDADFSMRSNGSTPAPTGVAPYAGPGLAKVEPSSQVIDVSSVIFRGPIGDPEGDAVRLEVELSHGGGVAMLVGPLIAGGQALLRSPVEEGMHGWRARAVDEHGQASAWTVTSTFEVLAGGSKGAYTSGCTNSAAATPATFGMAVLALLALARAR